MRSFSLYPLDSEPDAPATTSPKLGVMSVIFLVSLFAVSFPSLSKLTRFLRIPHIVFFMGKHFGTGVILSTAFCHLLPDSFESLHDPRVRERWGIGRYTGLIILSSLLSIFLVEYVSTAYVDRLQADPSAPPSRDPSPAPSSRTPLLYTPPPPPPNPTQDRPAPVASTSSSTISYSTDLPTISERTPLILHQPQLQFEDPQPQPIAEQGQVPPHQIHPPHSPTCHRSKSFSHFPSPPTHAHSHCHSDADACIFEGHHRHEDRPLTCSRESMLSVISLYDGAAENPKSNEQDMDDHRIKNNTKANTNHTNTHSHHSHSHENSHGHEHAHIHGYYFGGEERDVEAGDDEDDEDEDGHTAPRVGRRRQVVGILVLQMGIMIHSFVIGLTLAITSGSDFTTLVTAILFHQLFEGLSLGIRIASLPAPKVSPVEVEVPPIPVDGLPSTLPATKPDTGASSNHPPFLKVTLSILFAVTTPVGMFIGFFAFARGSPDIAEMKFTQGLMSAVSAGMLIYAACVEMLAGDFVMDPHLWRSGIWRQALALGSLFAGTAAMAVID